jgi:molecular chaperone GrpE
MAAATRKRRSSTPRWSTTSALKGAAPVSKPEEQSSVPSPQSSDEAAADVAQDLDDLLEVRRERDEYLELAQRTKADFDNYRRRVAREAEEAAQRSVAGLVAQLIPALDNLERALRAAGIDPSADAPAEEAEDDRALERGVLLTYRDLRETLNRAGVQPYDPEGEKFDPEWHEALQTRSADGVEPGNVLEVVEQGYRLDGKVLRPARVIVSE